MSCPFLYLQYCDNLAVINVILNILCLRSTGDGVRGDIPEHTEFHMFT